MADPLSITASIVGILTALATVSKKLHAFHEDFTEAETEIKQLTDEVGTLIFNLKQIEEAQVQGLLARNSILDLGQVLQKLQAVATETATFLQNSINKSKGFRGAYWAFSGKKKCVGFSRRLEAYKLTLVITLTLTNISSGQELQDRGNEILHGINAINKRLHYTDDYILQRYLVELETVYESSTVAGQAATTESQYVYDSLEQRFELEPPNSELMKARSSRRVESQSFGAHSPVSGKPTPALEPMNTTGSNNIQVPSSPVDTNGIRDGGVTAIAEQDGFGFPKYRRLSNYSETNGRTPTRQRRRPRFGTSGHSETIPINRHNESYRPRHQSLSTPRDKRIAEKKFFEIVEPKEAQRATDMHINSSTLDREPVEIVTETAVLWKTLVSTPKYRYSLRADNHSDISGVLLALGRDDFAVFYQSKSAIQLPKSDGSILYRGTLRPGKHGEQVQPTLSYNLISDLASDQAATQRIFKENVTKTLKDLRFDNCEQLIGILQVTVPLEGKTYRKSEHALCILRWSIGFSGRVAWISPPLEVAPSTVWVLSPNACFLACQQDILGGGIFIYDTKEGKRVRMIFAKTGGRLVWSQNCEYLLYLSNKYPSRSLMGTISIYSVATGFMIHELCLDDLFYGHDNAIARPLCPKFECSFTPGSKNIRIVRFGSTDRQVCQSFQPNRGQKEKRFCIANHCCGMIHLDEKGAEAFTPSFIGEKGHEIFHNPFFSPDGSCFIAFDKISSRLKMVDARSGDVLKVFASLSDVTVYAFDSEGKRIIKMLAYNGLWKSQPPQIHIWEPVYNYEI